ncbi:hydroxymethylglutaryl- synthase [Ophiostoma piceae UAMH 11346]|uniref:Hydroxymethylglutaryl-synthase n=1 Tax=Ophiostoma piceae (strain UAMH 11346) TaxID=1262450 RepID=S3CAK7_OPHP1|nr:hydroxymethylglutaryl- synthase [Ophiostoma piceae UAMH 11346]
MSSRPENIGIKAIEIYFPSQYVEQAELEKFDGVSTGKYTIGLGQTNMSFCDDREDIYSFALTATKNLLENEYPYVDGHYSITCYTRALDAAYKAYNARETTLLARANGSNGHTEAATPNVPLDRFDYVAFHAPTCKLVAKSYARLLYNDYVANPDNELFAGVPAEVRDIDYEKSLTDKVVEKTFMGLTKKTFQERVNGGIQVATNVGNMYCGSVWGGLASVLSYTSSEALEGKRIGLFSYGSGLAATFCSFRIRGSTATISKTLDIPARLAARRAVPPATFDALCDLRKKAHLQKGYKPEGEVANIKAGTYYLEEIDEMFQRKYAIKA